MSTQPNLFDKKEFFAHARRTDPQTSHDAAASVRRIRESQADVLTVIRKYGPISDEGMIHAYRAMGLSWQSDSGLRTRRSELVALGAVVDSGYTIRTQSNRQSILWKVA